MDTLDQILLEAIPPVYNCEPKDKAAKQARETAKKKIEELIKERDRSQPYKPDLEYKEGLMSDVKDLNGRKINF